MQRLYYLYVAAIFFFLLEKSLVAQLQPDRKDYALAALEAQRNEAWNREARCQSEAQFMIDDLNRQVANLKRQLEEKDKPQ